MNYEEAYDYVVNKVGSENGMKLFLMITNNKTTEGISLIKKLTACDDNTAQIIWGDLISEYRTEKSNPIIEAREQRKKEQSLLDKANIPKCPICNSNDLSKITAAKKIAKVAVFGIYGMGDNGKTWKCNNCGSRF